MSGDREMAWHVEFVAAKYEYYVIGQEFEGVLMECTQRLTNTRMACSTVVSGLNTSLSTRHLM